MKYISSPKYSVLEFPKWGWNLTFVEIHKMVVIHECAAVVWRCIQKCLGHPILYQRSLGKYTQIENRFATIVSIHICHFEFLFFQSPLINRYYLCNYYFILLYGPIYITLGVIKYFKFYGGIVKKSLADV